MRNTIVNKFDVFFSILLTQRNDIINFFGVFKVMETQKKVRKIMIKKVEKI